MVYNMCRESRYKGLITERMEWKGFTFIQIELEVEHDLFDFNLLLL